MEDSGSAELVRAESHTSRVQWYVPGRQQRSNVRTLRPASQGVYLFPDTSPYPIPDIYSQSIYDRALQSIRFMQRYHPGIQIPSRLLAKTMLDDEQKSIQQALAGDELVGSTISIVADYGDDSLLILCAGGQDRCELCMFEPFHLLTCSCDSRSRVS